MTTQPQRAPSPAPTTNTLIDWAISEGVSVCWTPPHHHTQAEYAHAADTIWLRRDLTDAEARSLLAHELGHHFYGDNGPQPPPIEQRAWRWAARALISAGEYAAAEDSVGPDPGALAEHLEVTRELVEAYQSTLHARGADVA